MFDSTQIRIVELRNELNAQRQASELSWGQLALPGNAPTATWNGNISIGDIPFGSATAAKFKATFTRSDGRNIPPLVDLAVGFSTSPTGIEIERNNGAAISIDSETSTLEANGPEVYATGVGADSVVFTIEFPVSAFLGLYRTFSSDANNIALSVTAQAISPVVGSLSLERITDE